MTQALAEGSLPAGGSESTVNYGRRVGGRFRNLGGDLVHPYFDSSSYPWDRDDARALHAELCRAFSNPNSIDLISKSCGGDLPSLTPGRPDDMWKEVLETLASAQRLRVLGERLKAYQKPLVHKAFEAIAAAGSDNELDNVGNDVFKPYLQVLLSAISHLDIPGLDRPVPLEAVWTRPTFVTAEGVTPLHSIFSKRVVAIEAPAGFGKTTLSKVISIALAKDFLQEDHPRGASWQLTYLGVKPGDVPHLPVLVDLKNIAEFSGPESLTFSATPSMDKHDHASIDRFVREGGVVVFMLDGLDEIEPSRRSRVIQLISKIRIQWPKCYFIITSRTFEIGPLAGAQVYLARMAKFYKTGTEELIRKWDDLLNATGGPRINFRAAMQENFLDDGAEHSFVSSPLVVAFLASSYTSTGSLPNNKARLLMKIADWLFASRSEIRAREGVDLPTTKRVLQAIAYHQTTREAADALSADEAVINATKLTGFDPTTVGRVLSIEAVASNCLVVDNNGRLTFWHDSLKDYFAASWLVGVFRGAKGKKIPSAVADGFGHVDIGDMMIALLATQYPTSLLELIEKTTPLGESSIDNVRAAALHSRIIKIAGLQGYKFNRDLERSISRRAASYLALSDERMRDMSIGDRVETLRALSTLGMDERLYGPPLRRSLLVGAGGIKLGKFPVTVQEYGRYLREQSQRKIHLPFAWDQQTETRNAAVTGVTWSQANDYCSWLSREMSTSGPSSEPMVARLPTIEEWCAMTGSSGVRGRWDRAQPPVTSQPVGVYIEETGPFGHQDLSHGAWEWIGPSLTTKRRYRVIINSSLAASRHQPVWRRVRGSMQSPVVGFRVVFERER